MDDNRRSGKAFLQILLPLIAMIAAIGVGIYYLVFSNQATIGTISDSGDIAAIYLLFLAAPPILLFVAVFVFLIMINRKAKLTLQTVFPKITERIEQANHSIRVLANSSVKPLVETEARVHAIRHIFSRKGKNGK